MRTYTIGGKIYPSVTGILDHVSGRSLNMWYAKRAAQAAALPLVLSGMYTPDPDDELEEIAENSPMRMLAEDQAVAEACDWRINMLAAELHRDYRGWVGTIVHRFRQYAPGGDLYGWCVAQAQEIVPKYYIRRMARFGVDRNRVEQDVAHEAMKLCRRWSQFADGFRTPRRTEFVVVSNSPRYAGTCDGIATYTRPEWERRVGPWPFGARAEATVVEDLKTSKSVSPHARLQLAAYAAASAEDLDGMIALHCLPDGVRVRAWTAKAIRPAYEAFCHLADYVSALTRIPRAYRRGMPLLEEDE